MTQTLAVGWIERLDRFSRELGARTGWGAAMATYRGAGGVSLAGDLAFALAALRAIPAPTQPNTSALDALVGHLLALSPADAAYVSIAVGNGRKGRPSEPDAEERS